MGCPEIEMNEGSRQMTAKASGILNMICVLPSLIILSVGAYIQVAIQEQISLIEGFNGDVLPAFMIIFGFLGAFIGLFGGKVCWANRICSKRMDWSKYLFPLVIINLILSIFVFVSAIMCFAQIAMLESSFEKGLSSAMRSYKNDRMKKSEIDTLQISYKCCGVRSYTDWFHVSWIHEEYLSEEKKKLLASYTTGDYLNDDVPFSCCIANVLRPCVHHHVHDNDMHYNYDYRTKVTLYRVGCKDALMDIYGNRLLTDVGALVLSISFLQMITLVMMRLLQTSVDASLENDNPEDPSLGYIFPCSGKGAIKAVKREVKTFHKKDRRVTNGVSEDPTTEALLDGNDDNISIDTDDISLNSSFEDEGVYEENLPTVEEENPYMTINSAEMLTYPKPPRHTSISGIGGQVPDRNQYPSGQNLTGQNVVPSYHVVSNAINAEHRMVSNHMVGADQHGIPSNHMAGADQHRMPSNHMMGVDQHRMPSNHMTGVDQHRMPSNHMMDADQHRLPSNHMMDADQHRLPSNHMMDADQHGLPSNHMMDADQHGMPSNHMMDADQHGMPSNHVIGAEMYRASSDYIAPLRTHTYVNELPQGGNMTQM